MVLLLLTTVPRGLLCAPPTANGDDNPELDHQACASGSARCKNDNPFGTPPPPRQTLPCLAMHSAGRCWDDRRPGLGSKRIQR